MFGNIAIVRVRIRKSEQEHGPVITHRKPGKLLAHLGVHDIDQFISRPVAVNLKCGGFIPEKALDPIFRPERQLTHTRMQAVGADHEIEFALDSACEVHSHAGTPLRHAFDTVGENCLDPAFDPIEDRFGEIASRKTYVSAGRGPSKNGGRKSRYTFSGSIHYLHFLDAISLPSNFLQKVHSVSNIEPGAPEIDNVAARTQSGGLLDDGGLESEMIEPVG